MKKNTLLLFAIFSLSIIQSKAQDFYLGFRADPNIGFFQSDDKRFKSDGSKIGFNFGLIADYKLTDNYLFGTGLTINSMGGKFINTESASVTRSEYSLRYLEIPLTLKLRTNEIGYSKYFGQFGLTTGVNVRARSKGEVNTAGVITAFDNIDVTKDINILRLGLLIGGGIEYSLGGRTSLIGGLSYNNGLTDITDQKDFKVVNSYVALNLGIVF